MNKLTLQQWLAGTDITFQKTRTPLKKVPVLNKLAALKNFEQGYTLSEKLDLTRASDFRVQQSSEDFLVASISLPLFGKKVIGNDTGLALPCFDYTDQEGDAHKVIGICAYSISGVRKKITRPAPRNGRRTEIASPPPCPPPSANRRCKSTWADVKSKTLQFPA